jgi:hypothetical protein
LDGCDFLVKINGKTYKPINESIIDESCKIIDKKICVEIEYKLLKKTN